MRPTPQASSATDTAGARPTIRGGTTSARWCPRRFWSSARAGATTSRPAAPGSAGSRRDASGVSVLSVFCIPRSGHLSASRPLTPASTSRPRRSTRCATSASRISSGSRTTRPARQSRGPPSDRGRAAAACAATMSGGTADVLLSG
ncbi:uncharacterized protein COLE_07345 [Cutaneotrichosporon oleaginosum]|uniref:uncharacterized protein n=1 Tax=Cutaneotrichosporon oleaginosum TaxID=879819 RepID=UPI00132B75FB|nr:hypothetical protein COLE_07345 [Cutaneotrichosporon oleaginosum]